MVATAIKNPFKAGYGVHPPYFAGRQEETDVIGNTLDTIMGEAGQMDHAPNPALLLIGPRGVGKTVLLNRSIRDASSRDIRSAKISPTLLAGSQRRLVNHVFPSGSLKKAFGKRVSVRADFMQPSMTIRLKEAEQNFRLAVHAYLSKEPLLLVLDEAHTCKPEALKLLFGTFQDCMSVHLPLAVIIAGTPDLAALLRRSHVNHEDRTRQLRFNTLTDNAAKKALEVPTRKSGRPMKPAALKTLLKWSDNHPYFIQLVGKHSWTASKNRGGSDITMADAKRGITEAERHRDILCNDQLRELRKRDLDVYACQSARLIRGHKGAGIGRFQLEKLLMKKNIGMDKRKAMMIVKELQEAGYLWDPYDRVMPGLPSMFDFVIGKLGAV